jgi:hypothetical protein
MNPTFPDAAESLYRRWSQAVADVLPWQMNLYRAKYQASLEMMQAALRLPGEAAAPPAETVDEPHRLEALAIERVSKGQTPPGKSTSRPTATASTGASSPSIPGPRTRSCSRNADTRASGVFSDRATLPLDLRLRAGRPAHREKSCSGYFAYRRPSPGLNAAQGFLVDFHHHLIARLPWRLTSDWPAAG